MTFECDIGYFGKLVCLFINFFLLLNFNKAKAKVPNYHSLKLTFFLGGGGHPIRDTVQGKNQSRPVASSGKPLGERQLAIPLEIKIYTPYQDAGGTNDQVGQGFLDHSYLPPASGDSISNCTRRVVEI